MLVRRLTGRLPPAQPRLFLFSAEYVVYFASLLFSSVFLSRFFFFFHSATFKNQYLTGGNVKDFWSII
jgi:hypothetical protein